MVRTWLALTALVLTAWAGGAAAADPADATGTPPAGGGATATGTPAGSPTPAMPPAGATATGTTAPSASPTAIPPPGGVDTGTVVAGVPMIDAAAQAASPARYGVGARLRVTSVPKWLLGLFLDQSVPLTSYTAGLEFFRRSGSFDFVLGVAYQSLSPNAGNWLGKGNDPSTETDYVQFDGLGAYSVDAAFILHTEFNDYFGMHYGGGVGIGITTGRMLRTSDGTGDPATNAGCVNSPGDPTKCFPKIAGCNQGPCTEAQLKSSEGGTDASGMPSRFSDGHVPTVYPIVNIITGLDVRLPNAPGLAIKLDIGYFFPYFFFGPSVAYQI